MRRGTRVSAQAVCVAARTAGADGIRRKGRETAAFGGVAAFYHFSALLGLELFDQLAQGLAAVADAVFLLRR